MEDQVEHGAECVRSRRIGAVRAAPNVVIGVDHVLCAHHPADAGNIGLAVMWQPDEAPEPEKATLLMSVGEAVLLANRIMRAIDLALVQLEEPADPSLELARIVAREETS